MAKPLPTYLYHGTSARYLKSILRVGLEPRGTRATRNNWKHVAHQSNPRMVYLTDSYAPYFAHNACRDNDDVLIVEVALDSLNPANLFPDEDFLEQVSRGRDDLPANLTLSQRTLRYRKRQFEFDTVVPTGNPEIPFWFQASLAGLGTCSHRGTISPEVITRFVTYPYKSNIQFNFVWDPTITLINQHICGSRYRELTRRLFAGEFTPRETLADLTLEERFVALPPIEGWHVEEISL